MDSDFYVRLELIQDYYYYCSFDDFKVIVDIKTNFFNASKLCDDGGKVFGKWLRNKTSQDFMDYVKKKLNCGKILYEFKGKRNRIAFCLRGTYVCPELFIRIACWVSNDLSYKVTKIIQHVEKTFKNHIIEIGNLKSKIKILKEENQKYEQVKEDICPKTLNKQKQNLFILTKIDSPYPLYVIRCQRGEKECQIKRLQKKYASIEIIFELEYYPNSINLFNRAKENLPNMKSNGNKVKLINNYTVDEFVNDLKKLAEKKF